MLVIQGPLAIKAKLVRSLPPLTSKYTTDVSSLGNKTFGLDRIDRFGF